MGEFLGEGGPGVRFEETVRFGQTTRSGNGSLDRRNVVNRGWEVGIYTGFGGAVNEQVWLVGFPVSTREQQKEVGLEGQIESFEWPYPEDSGEPSKDVEQNGEAHTVF